MNINWKHAPTCPSHVIITFLNIINIKADTRPGLPPNFNL